MTRSRNRFWFVGLLCTILVSGCGQGLDSNDASKDVSAQTSEFVVDHSALLNATNLFIYSQLSDALNHAQTLDRVIASFLHHPNPASLKESQEVWVKTYNAYLKVSAFYSVPKFEKPQYIEQNQTYKDLHQLLDLWPVEGGYIDFLPGYPLSGIINDMTLKISEAALLEQHGFSEFSYASVGFHPLEFMLFGEDGQRSARDFIPKENSIEVVGVDVQSLTSEVNSIEQGSTDNHPQDPIQSIPSVSHEAQPQSTQGELMADGQIEPQNHNRRREYLRIVSALLVSNLQKLVDRWDPGQGYYAKAWRHPDSQENLTRVFRSITGLLYRDVLTNHLTPWISQPEIENWRSPYSNTDLQNVTALIQGIKLWWTAENSVKTVVAQLSPNLNIEVETQLSTIVSNLNQIEQDTLKTALSVRQEALKPLQTQTLTLLENMYTSAQLLGTQPLPLSME